MNNQRVLISGASIAGPTLAFWLARYGFHVTVVERAPGIRPGGYAVDFRGSAMRVLETMGLVDQIKAHETRTGQIAMVNADNKVLARLPDGFTSGDLEILRSDLANILYEATRNSARYIFDDSIRSLNQTAEAVEVSFASGKTETFDLVVGADGLHSNVRALAFGPEQQFVRHLGYYVCVFTVPDFLGLHDAGRYYMERGRRAGCFGNRNTGTAKAAFYFASPPLLELNRRDTAAQKALVREKFAGAKWESQRMLAMMDAAPDFYFDSLAQVKMESWSRGRVVLLGDAAACPSPVSGMGTSIAMVGAYVLAGELQASSGDYAVAFAQYEAAMREFVAEAQKMADSVDWLIPRTRVRLWFSRRIWNWMPQSTLRKLMIEQPGKIAAMVEVKDYE